MARHPACKRAGRGAPGRKGLGGPGADAYHADQEQQRRHEQLIADAPNAWLALVGIFMTEAKAIDFSCQRKRDNFRRPQGEKEKKRGGKNMLRFLPTTALGLGTAAGGSSHGETNSERTAARSRVSVFGPRSALGHVEGQSRLHLLGGGKHCVFRAEQFGRASNTTARPVTSPPCHDERTGPSTSRWPANTTKLPGP